MAILAALKILHKTSVQKTCQNLLLQLEAWARNGLTDEQIAANIGIRRETLIEWKKKYSNISNTLKRGKEVVDIQVENSCK